MTRTTRTATRWAGLLALCLAPLAISTAALAQRAPFPIPDPDPEIERESFIVADGFEVNLFAADPILAKPLQINFDPQGRLWVASSEVYPQIQPGQNANDKVLILEDRNGDGKADRTTVFAEGLLIPTGIEPGDGGAYVANSTELLHLKDTNGDGKADRTRVVLSGFGTEDTHHILHTLRWGYDGQLYFNQSIYIHSHIETPYGVRRLGGGGIWEFRPETMQLEVFLRGLVNPWGHHFDRWGQSFVTDGAGGEGINYGLPGAYFVTAPDAVRILKGLNPGSPKYCGLETISGRHFPEDWQGNLVTNDFRGNRVCRFVLSDDGSGFAAREQAELIKTRHVAFRPIDVKMGPDGALYIADWYNPIIQHGEVDFRDPRRDHTRGRIWRVTAKNRPLVERPRLADASTDDLLRKLASPEDWTRQHSKRVLKERGAKAVVPGLAAWVKSLDKNDPEFEHLRLEGLWTYQSLDVVEPDLLAAVLNSPDPRARAAATRVVAHWHGRLSDPLGLLADRVEDEHPRVRLEAVRALAQIQQPRAAELALRALDHPVDTFLDYALWLTARQLQSVWLPEVQAGRFDFGGKPSHLVFALQAAGSPDVVKPLIGLLKAGRVSADQDAAVQSLIATLGDTNDLAVVFDLSLQDASIPAPRRAALLQALVRAAKQRNVSPAGDLSRIANLLDNSDPALRGAAVAAVGAWKLESLRPQLVAIATGDKASSEVRAAAIEALVALGGDASRSQVIALTEKGKDRRVQSDALAALTAIDLAEAAKRTASWLGHLEPPQYGDSERVLDRFLERKDGPAPLAQAIQSSQLPGDLAKLWIRRVRASGRDLPSLNEALTKAGGLSEGTKPPTPEEMTALIADVAQMGDPARGEVVFRRQETTCLKCHAIAGAGGQVGPGLESIGASAQVDYLIDSILQPGKAVKENYHAMVVATEDGKLLTGIKVRQTDTDLVLRDSEDREVLIPLSSIEEQKPGGSLMPAGLADGLTRGELLDLVRFLSELGKVGPYSVSKERICRRWQALEPTPEAQSAMIRSSVDAVVQEEASWSWRSIYTTVAGLVPLSDAPQIARVGDAPPVRVIRTQVDVTVPGPLTFAFDSSRGLTAWIDGRRTEFPADAPDTFTIELDRGVHTLTLAIEPARGELGVRCRIEEPAGRSTRAQVILGK
jgi:putative heme-binding domain-containing protein